MSFRPLSIAVLIVACTLIGCESTGNTGNQDAYTSQAAQIYVDGDGDDWASLPVRHTDAGDGSGVSIERLWTAHSSNHFFLRVELNQSINLQEDNDLTLYLDTDNNASTGKQTQGLGTELAWTFGERSGRFEGTEVEHADIGLTSLPTVQSDVFEIALDRAATPADSASLFQGDSLRVALSTNGDRLPDGTGGVGYVLTDAETTVDAPSLDRPGTSEVRLMSYNAVNNFDRELNSLFIEDHQPSYRRILGAVGPDVIAFQEVYDQTADRVETVAEGELGLADEWNWTKAGLDLVLGSRFPIVASHTIAGYEDVESGAFLLDTEEALGSRLVVINMHPPCCNFGPEDGEPSRNAQRQRVVDGVMAFVRMLKNGEGPFDVASDTPIAILGDMNFVGAAQHPRTLRTGEIVNNEAFGPSVDPDWDGSSLLDTRPRHTASPMHTTWIDDGSSFPPGRLDYAFVTDSVLDVVHEFVLYTPALSENALQTHDLQSDDTDRASDHLPVVIDVQSR